MASAQCGDESRKKTCSMKWIAAMGSQIWARVPALTDSGTRVGSVDRTRRAIDGLRDGGEGGDGSLGAAPGLEPPPLSPRSTDDAIPSAEGSYPLSCDMKLAANLSLRRRVGTDRPRAQADRRPSSAGHLRQPMLASERSVNMKPVPPSPWTRSSCRKSSRRSITSVGMPVPGLI